MMPTLEESDEDEQVVTTEITIYGRTLRYNQFSVTFNHIPKDKFKEMTEKKAKGKRKSLKDKVSKKKRKGVREDEDAEEEERSVAESEEELERLNQEHYRGIMTLVGIRIEGMQSSIPIYNVTLRKNTDAKSQQWTLLRIESLTFLESSLKSWPALKSWMAESKQLNFDWAIVKHRYLNPDNAAYGRSQTNKPKSKKNDIRLNEDIQKNFENILSVDPHAIEIFNTYGLDIYLTVKFEKDTEIDPDTGETRLKWSILNGSWKKGHRIRSGYLESILRIHSDKVDSIQAMALIDDACAVLNNPTCRDTLVEKEISYQFEDERRVTSMFSSNLTLSDIQVMEISYKKSTGVLWPVWNFFTKSDYNTETRIFEFCNSHENVSVTLIDCCDDSSFVGTESYASKVQDLAGASPDKAVIVTMKIGRLAMIESRVTKLKAYMMQSNPFSGLSKSHEKGNFSLIFIIVT